MPRLENKIMRLYLDALFYKFKLIKIRNVIEIYRYDGYLCDVCIL